MIYLIFGQNSFFAHRKLKQILAERQKFFEKNFPIFKFSGKNLQLDTIEEKIQNNTLFGETTAIVIEEIWQNQKFKKEFLKRGKKFTSSNILLMFFEKQDLNKKDPFFEFIQKIGQVYEFPEPSLHQIRQFIKDTLVQRRFQIQPSAEQLLIEFTQKDLWNLNTQLEKLMAFRSKERIIKKEDVLLLVKPKIDTNIFQTIDALAEKNKKKALAHIYNHLEQGESPLYILSMMKYQFKNLLMVKEQATLGKTLTDELKDMHPLVLRKARYQSRRFTLEQLKKFYHKIFKIDLAIKQGKIAPEEGLELLVLDL